jgi:hypothetical protein
MLTILFKMETSSFLTCSQTEREDAMIDTLWKERIKNRAIEGRNINLTAARTRLPISEYDGSSQASISLLNQVTNSEMFGHALS